MIQVVQPGMRAGTIRVPASKSTAHRLLIAAAFSKKPCTVFCKGVSKDIEATALCLNALGAKIEYDEKTQAFSVRPVTQTPHMPADLYCGESGTTLRFLLPLAAVLGVTAVFHREGLLSKRPMGPLVEELEKHGVQIRQEGDLLYCSGKLQPGPFVMPGNISSQFISGLLLALPLADADSSLQITESIESEGYIAMTEQIIASSGVSFEKQGASYRIPGRQCYSLPENVTVESDWSSAAAFLCIGAMSDQGISIPGMNLHSCHADRAILDVLQQFGAEVTTEDEKVTVRKKELKAFVMDASDAPDLVPVVSALACSAKGTTKIIHAERLRFKESDRLRSTVSLIRALGGEAEETADGLLIHGTGHLQGGTIDPANDHRIAMAAAVAASICTGEVRIQNSACVGKSYPAFFEDFETLEVLG